MHLIFETIYTYYKHTELIEQVYQETDNSESSQVIMYFVIFRDG